MKSDRRKFFRVPVKIRMLIKEEEGTGELYFLSKNLSLGGAFLVSDLLLETGTRVYLEFTLPHRPTLIIVKGEIVWAKDEVEEEVSGGMGIKFLNLDSESKKYLTEFIGQRLRPSRKGA